MIATATEPNCAAVENRPLVGLEPGRLAWVIDEAELHLVATHGRWKLYQRGGALVRIGRANGAEKDARRAAGAPILQAATAPMLLDIFNRAIDWRRLRAGEPLGAAAPVDCPAKIANLYLARAGQWQLPALTGIVSAPILLDDGSILDRPGFDLATGLYLAGDGEWPRPPAPLSREAVESAVRTLLEPFGEFPFRAEADRSVIVSAILTLVQRRLLFSAPAHAIDAPTQGSGKSLIADCIARIATGLDAPSLSVNRDEDELRKKLVSILMIGDPLVALDNITRSLNSDALASILTQPVYQDRLLGTNTTVRVPTNTLFLVTGNNLTFSGDMPSRIVVSRLEPEVERPEERTFAISNLRDHISRNRRDLVCAALTILQAFFIAGRPSQHLRPFGRFEQWSSEIREAIVWAGLPDPCLTREEVIDADPERDSALAVLSNWHRADLGEIALRNLIERAEQFADLNAALLDVAADTSRPGQISARRLGAWPGAASVGSSALTSSFVGAGILTRASRPMRS